MTPRRILSAALPAAALAVALTLSGCGLGSPDSVISAGSQSMTTPVMTPSSGTADADGPRSEQPDPGTADAPSTPDSEPAASTDPGSTAISPADAGSTAAQRHDGSAVVDIELDRAHGTTVWEVTVVSPDGRWKVDVDVADGSILGNKSDDPEDAPKYLDRLGRASLDHAAAIEAVLATHPGSRLVEMGLDDEDGAVVWEAEIVTAEHQKFDITIDAASGAALKDELDD